MVSKLLFLLVSPECVMLFRHVGVYPFQVLDEVFHILCVRHLLFQR